LLSHCACATHGAHSSLRTLRHDLSAACSAEAATEATEATTAAEAAATYAPSW